MEWVNQRKYIIVLLGEKWFTYMKDNQDTYRNKLEIGSWKR